MGWIFKHIRVTFLLGKRPSCRLRQDPGQDYFFFFFYWVFRRSHFILPQSLIWARVTVAFAAYSYMLALFWTSGKCQEDFGVITLRNYLDLAVLLHRHHKSMMSNDFILSVCKFVSLLTHLRCTKRTFACTVWLMCVIISQLANIYMHFIICGLFGLAGFTEDYVRWICFTGH